MYAVFVPAGKNDRLREYEGLGGNAWKPIAWFDERERALGYAEYLMTINEFSKVVFMPESHIAGSDYVHEIVC